MIRFSDKVDVSEIVKDNFDADEYYVSQLDAESFEVITNWSEVSLDFLVTWDDPDISVEDMWFEICGEFNTPQMINSREVGQ